MINSSLFHVVLSEIFEIFMNLGCFYYSWKKVALNRSLHYLQNEASQDPCCNLKWKYFVHMFHKKIYLGSKYCTVQIWDCEDYLRPHTSLFVGSREDTTALWCMSKNFRYSLNKSHFSQKKKQSFSVALHITTILFIHYLRFSFALTQNKVSTLWLLTAYVDLFPPTLTLRHIHSC